MEGSQITFVVLDVLIMLLVGGSAYFARKSDYQTDQRIGRMEQKMDSVGERIGKDVQTIHARISDLKELHVALKTRMDVMDRGH